MTNPNQETPPEAEPDIDSLDPANAAAETLQFEEVEEASEPANAPESEIEKLRAELAEAEKRALLAAADLENARKRANKNAQQQVRYAALPMMSELLECVDNLKRAVESARQESESQGSSITDGVSMVADQILGILKENHCQPIAAIGEPFDPNLHEAIQMQPSDEYPANTVMMELRAGYRLHDRVIRPAQVFVSTGTAD